MTQQALDFGRDHRVAEAHRKVMMALNDAVDAVGLLQAAGACGCKSSELSDVLGGLRENRYLRLEWLLAIIDITPLDYRTRLIAAMIGWVGFAPRPLAPLKPEEKLANLKQRVAAKFGAAGLELIEEEEARR